MFNIIKIIVLSWLFAASAQAAVFENWANGEPNNSGNCGWMYANGTWDDSGCDRDEPTLCYSGKAWILGFPSRGLFGGVTNTDPEEQCANAGSGYKFAAPYNAYENEVVRVIVAGADVPRVRINLSKSGNNWNSNSGVPYITRWFGPDPLNFDEPDDGGTNGNQDCVAMDRQGYWYDIECSQSLRFVCAEVGVQWYISDTSTTQDDLYSGERACRNSNKLFTFEGPASDISNVNIVNRLNSTYSNSATFGDLFWVNVNDRLTEGTFQTSENRYFWRLGGDESSSEPNNSGNEDCAEKNSGSEWNDVSCTSATKSFACYHLGTNSWASSAIQSSTGDDYIQGSAACQAIGPQWSFWAPHRPDQNSAAPQNVWFNITDKAVESIWEANNRASFWGKTDTYTKDDEGFYNFSTTIIQPNNGSGNPTGYDKREPTLNVGSNEDCAVQLGNGTWHDLPCANANGFACYDKGSDEWRIAGASPNLGIFFGESKCQELDSTRRFHFSAPENRQQQNDLSTFSGNSVWINATDRAVENTWQYNEYLTFWDEGQPVADEWVDCAVSSESQSGFWLAQACSGSHQYLCYDAADTNADGNEWFLAPANNIENNPGILACEAVQASAKFLSPDTFDEFAKVNSLLAATSGIQTPWINVSDAEQENNWQYNQQRFWAIGEPDLPSGNSSEDCAVMRETDGLWTSELCTGVNREYLCLNTSNETWALSGITGDMTNFSEGQNACEALNTSSLDNYLFSAPKYQWENSEALTLLAGKGSVWINGNDRIREDRWIFNEFLYWSASALGASAESNDCLTMNSLGYWQDTACDEGNYKVACYSGDGWYLSPTTSDLSNFSDAQRVCNEIGDGYRFFAPISVKQNRDLRALIGGSEKVWINGLDIAEEGLWVFNSMGLPTPNWASTQPNGELTENCAYIDSDGLWHDAECSESRNLTCLNAVGDLFISNSTHSLTTNFDAAHQACKDDGGVSFFAPTTFNQNENLRQLMTDGNELWLNTTDALIESRWALNIAVTADYNAITPNTAAIDGCGSLDNAGAVTAGPCNPSQAKSVTCYDGNEWRVSTAKVLLGITATDGKLIRNAFAACQSEFSGNFTFAVPRNTDLMAKWELAQALALSGKDSIWLNLADWHAETAFSANMSFQNLALSAIQTDSGCAYVNGQSDGWLVEQQCDQRAAHFACYNGSNWQVAPADGTIDNPAEPQLGVDGWDQSYGDLRCKEFFGPGYRFTAPITSKEDANLQQVVKRLENTVKDTWINYYANRFMSGNGQQWFADRINLNIIDGIALDKGATTEDCGALTNDSGSLILTDENCSLTHRALCYNGANWLITTNSVQWNQAASECGSQFGEDHIFALPRDEYERNAVLASIPNTEVVWTNYNDLSIESKWRANVAFRQWWADEEPKNLGNRDCVVLDSSGSTAGLWRSDYCDQVFHNFACKNGTQWQITAEQGIWAQGFTACRKLGDGWFFDFPEDYFANLNVATTLSASTSDLKDFDNGDIQDSASFSGKSVWINLTDQYREKDWQRGRLFNDWAVSFAFDDNRDCAFVDASVTEIEGQSVKGSWVPGLCHESDTVRKFACTNGKNWLLADAVNPELGNNWSAGFNACTALGSEWSFAAPVTSFDNERLKAALGINSAWINFQDVGTDGDWAANLSKPNLPPIIKFTTSTDVINTSPVNERLAGLQLQSSIIDPEGLPITSVVVTEENGLATAINVTACSGPNVVNGICQLDVTYTAPALTNIAKDLKFKFVATDAAGKTTVTFLTVEVLPPIIAWFDFDDVTRPNFDKTGNGNDAIDNPEQPYDFPPVVDGAIEMSQGSEKMTVDGTKLAMPKDYAIALRVWADSEDEAEYQQFRIEFLLANGDQTGQCFDLPGLGVPAAVVDANVAIYSCDSGVDQLWFQDDEGLIHSGANPELCLAHPDDGNDVNTNLRNINVSYCANVQHPWIIHQNGAEKGSIESSIYAGYYLYASSSNNDTNVVLANTSPTNKWMTEKTFGRGILQKGPIVNQPLLTFGDKTSYLTYTVGEDSGTSASPLAQEQWVNIVVNVEGTDLTVYIDGIAENTVTLTAAATANNDDLIVGNIPSALRSFIGRVDEVQVFSRPLNSLEIVEVLPEPPVGLAQFETSLISRQEPQFQGGSQINPVLVRRTDGSNGHFRATITSTPGTANDTVDFDAVNQQVTWAPDDAPIYVTPEYDLLPLMSASSGELIDSVEFNRDETVLVAIDLTVPNASPRGVLWEQGSSETGTLVAFDTAGQLIVRAGTGSGTGANVARLVISESEVNAKILDKTGTLFVEINKETSSVSAWFLENGLMATTEVVSLGTASAPSGFPSSLWTDGSAGSIGNLSTISARYIRDQVNGSNQNTSAHWVEIQAYDLAGTNIALGKTVTGFDGNDDPIVTPTSGSYSLVVDNNLATTPYLDMGNGLRKVVVDLGAVTELSRVNVLHYFSDSRTYNNTLTEISDDGITWTPIFDSSVSGTYVETSAGHNLDRIVTGEAIDVAGNYAFNGTVTSARFYEQSMPAQRFVENAKLISVNLHNSVPFDREPTEYFELNVTHTERSSDGLVWTGFNQGNSGSLSNVEVAILDYTKNSAGIFQFANSEMICSEPHAADNSGTVSVNGKDRLYRSCAIEVQRRTGGVGEVSVEYGINSQGLTIAYASNADFALDSTDILMDSDNETLTFSNGVRTRSIGFRVLSDLDGAFENNESFVLSLFNPRNLTTPDARPWLGDPNSSKVIVEDYALGKIEMSVENYTAPEALFGVDDFNIYAFRVLRSNGFNGPAEVTITAADVDATRGVDYQIVDVDGADILGSQYLAWLDGESASLPVYIKVFSDRYQEVNTVVQTTDENAACYDGPDADNLPDDLNRDCSASESFTLTLTAVSGAPVNADKITATVFLQDNTAPAVIKFTNETLGFTTVSELSAVSDSAAKSDGISAADVTAVVDVNDDGIYVEGVEAVYDRRIQVEIERSNSFAEHAVWLYVGGVAKGAAIAADFVGVDSSKSPIETTRNRIDHDAWMQSDKVRGDGTGSDEYRYLWVLPQAADTLITNDAVITTNVTSWYNGVSTSDSLNAINDGVYTPTYQVHPLDADGKFINFDWGVSTNQGGKVIFYNRPASDCCNQRIVGSKMEFYLAGVLNTDYQYDFTAASAAADQIEISIPDSVEYDEMRLVFSGADQNFSEIEVFAKSAAATDAFSVDVVVYDNNRVDGQNRNLELRIEPASNRDARVIELGTAGSASTAEYTDIEIVDANLAPSWTETATVAEVNSELGAGNLYTYTMPIKAGGSMKLDSRVPFGTSVGLEYRIKAIDPDWININYEISVDGGAFKEAGRTDTGGYLSWTTAMNDVWNFIAPNTTTLDSYTVDLDIKASDTDGEELNSSTNVTLNLAWRQIRLAASNECIFKTGNTIEWDYGLFGNKCENTDNYYWAALPVEGVDDAYQLINKSSKTCLYKLNGGDGGAGFRNCIGGAEEYWYFDRNGAGDKTIQRWDAVDNAWEYLCGNIGDGIDIKVGGSCSWDDARWK